MILTCNSCDKKFVVPDSAITASGRMVQCGSCGNKWRQFPLEKVKKTQSTSVPQKVASRPKPSQQNAQKARKIKKTPPKKQSAFARAIEKTRDFARKDPVAALATYDIGKGVLGKILNTKRLAPGVVGGTVGRRSARGGGGL